MVPTLDPETLILLTDNNLHRIVETWVVIREFSFLACILLACETDRILHVYSFGNQPGGQGFGGES
jgi:hypothetical protein